VGTLADHRSIATAVAEFPDETKLTKLSSIHRSPRFQ
jgi:hypothetical protein